MREGLILRSASEADRRAVILSLSAIGKHKAVEIKHAEELMYQNLSKQIPNQFIHELYELFKLILERHPIGERLKKRNLL